MYQTNSITNRYASDYIHVDLAQYKKNQKKQQQQKNPRELDREQELMSE